MCRLLSILAFARNIFGPLVYFSVSINLTPFRLCHCVKCAKTIVFYPSGGKKSQRSSFGNVQTLSVCFEIYRKCATHTRTQFFFVCLILFCPIRKTNEANTTLAIKLEALKKMFGEYLQQKKRVYKIICTALKYWPELA